MRRQEVRQERGGEREEEGAEELSYCGGWRSFEE